MKKRRTQGEIIRDSLKTYIRSSVQRRVSALNKKLGDIGVYAENSGQSYLPPLNVLLQAALSEMDREAEMTINENGIGFFVGPYVERLSRKYLDPVDFLVDAVSKKFRLGGERAKNRKNHLTTQVLDELVRYVTEHKQATSRDIAEAMGVDPPYVRAAFGKILLRHEIELEKHGIEVDKSKQRYVYRLKNF